MALMKTPICAFGWRAPHFALRDPDGREVDLEGAMGPNGLLVAFLCNHCPYVRAIGKRLGEDAAALDRLGIGVVGIMANDYRAYPADAPDKMRETAAEFGWTFPYLIDEDQSVARAYDAVCTPDFFGFDAQFGLQYRGRLDDAKMADGEGREPELTNAMRAVARGEGGPAEQTPSMGCSIKWRAA